MPFIATAKHTDDLVPTKTETVYIKKRSVDCHCAQLPQTCVISCPTSAVAAFPMVERTASLRLHSVCDSFPAMSLSVSPPMFLYVHCIGWGETVSSCRRTLLFFKPKFLFLYKTRRHSLFLRTDDGKTPSTKDSIDLLNMFSGEDAGCLVFSFSCCPSFSCFRDHKPPCFTTPPRLGILIPSFDHNLFSS